MLLSGLMFNFEDLSLNEILGLICLVIFIFAVCFFITMRFVYRSMKKKKLGQFDTDRIRSGTTTESSVRSRAASASGNLTQVGTEITSVKISASAVPVLPADQIITERRNERVASQSKLERTISEVKLEGVATVDLEDLDIPAFNAKVSNPQKKTPKLVKHHSSSTFK
jgi:hypothetical protein